MKKKLFFVISALMVIFFNSCTEDPVNTDEKKSPVVGEIYVSDEAFKYIGYGYDMTENYADPSHVKGIIFMGYKLPDEFTKKTKIEYSQFMSYSGESVSEYQSKLSNKFSASGKYKYFSGSLKVNFESEFYSNKNSSFATIQCMINKYQYSIINNFSRAELLKPYMTEQAVKDLNNSNLTPFQIYNMYGTHVITGAMMGARMDYNISIVSSLNKTGKSLEVLAKADYKTKFASASVSN